jgi:hypothetical protein
MKVFFTLALTTKLSSVDSLIWLVVIRRVPSSTLFFLLKESNGNAMNSSGEVIGSLSSSPIQITLATHGKSSLACVCPEN